MLTSLIISGAVSTLIVASYLTNPFSKHSIIRQTYIAKFINGTIKSINENHKLIITQNIFFVWFAVLKNGVHILNSRWHSSPASSATSVNEIIDDIYKLRFRPDKLLLTSGDHFSSLFVRNLGVFYYPTLDSAIPCDEKRWADRQAVYLQTVAYALGVFDKLPELKTTIVPTGRLRATGVNFHAYPSDTMYGILYALASLLGEESAQPAPSPYAPAKHKLATIPATELLLATYQDSLIEHYKKYRAFAFNEKLGLIKLDALMSGAKDITKRQSAFYDNVVFWKTTELAMKLELIEDDPVFLKDLKKRILKTFWLEKEGYFLEDLSTDGINNKYYSSDWLIVLATGFISPLKKTERKYFERSTEYIQNKRIDQPFPIKYQHETRASRQFAIVRLAVASYGGDSIWSFWGMEYIKNLIMLYTASGDKSYLEVADEHIAKYEKNILENKGFPEVYDKDGKLLETLFYRSIRQTGWVVGFDQVRSMRKAVVNLYTK